MPGTLRRKPFWRRPSTLCLLAATLLAATACASNDPARNEYPEATRSRRAGKDAPQGSILGEGGITIFGGKKSDEGGGGGAGIGVNSYLWRASLDTLAFMPLASADPFGGVIITDWYSPAETPDERFKVNVFILDRQLRADGLRAAVFRQKRQPDGRWADAPVDAATQTDLENAILGRARQLRISTAQR
jgi:hypothetical protein